MTAILLWDAKAHQENGKEYSSIESAQQPPEPSTRDGTIALENGKYFTEILPLKCRWRMTTDASRRLNCPCQQGSLSIHKHMCCLSTAKCRFFSRDCFKSELLECQIGSVWLHFNYSSHWILLVGDGRCATSVGKGGYVCRTTAYKTLLCLSASPQEWKWRSAMSLSACSHGVFLWVSARVTFWRECCSCWWKLWKVRAGPWVCCPTAPAAPFTRAGRWKTQTG